MSKDGLQVEFTVGRTFITPHEFKHARFSLGRWSRPMSFVAMIWNLYLAAVLFSPIEFPVDAGTFNCKHLSIDRLGHLSLLGRQF